jgi:hypothetical protein
MMTEQLLTADSINTNGIQFKKIDVLNNPIDQKERLNQLRTAMLLGNNHHHKVRLVVTNSFDQLIEIKAKVWSVTEKYVILKNSVTIPITCIQEVKFM